MHRHVITHRKNFSSAVEDRAGVVATFLDVGRESRTAQRRSHFLGDRVKQVLKDFQASGIECHRRGSKIMFPYESTRPVQRVGITMVALYSGTVAPPPIRFPPSRLVRS